MTFLTKDTPDVFQVVLEKVLELGGTLYFREAYPNPEPIPAPKELVAVIRPREIVRSSTRDFAMPTDD
jgi:hypothetical protein